MSPIIFFIVYSSCLVAADLVPLSLKPGSKPALARIRCKSSDAPFLPVWFWCVFTWFHHLVLNSLGFQFGSPFLFLLTVRPNISYYSRQSGPLESPITLGSWHHPLSGEKSDSTLCMWKSTPVQPAVVSPAPGWRPSLVLIHEIPSQWLTFDPEQLTASVQSLLTPSEWL